MTFQAALIYLFTLSVAGIIPLFFVLKNFRVDTKSAAIAALGFAPVLVALLNIAIVTLGIQQSIAQYLVPTAVYVGLFFLKRKPFPLRLEISLLKAGLIGIVFGTGYWFLTFSPPESEFVLLFPDSVWNLGLVSELKNHFLPRDPRWWTGDTFIYHYLTNLCISGVSNFSGLNVLQATYACNYATAIILFILIGLITERFALEAIIVFIFLSISSVAADYPAFVSFHRHMSSHDGTTTFFWSLPIMVSSIYIWYQLRLRSSENPGFFVLVAAIIGCSTFFAKGSLVLIFIALEFASLVKTFFLNRWWRIRGVTKKDWCHRLTYLTLPVVYFLLTMFYSSKNQIPLTAGIEIRDFSHFESWSLLSPFLAFYLVTLLYLVLDLKNFRRYKYELLFCSFINILLFLVFKHPGYSDLYFAFNAILINGLFVIFSLREGALARYTAAWILSAFLLVFLMSNGYVKGFSSLNITFDKMRPPKEVWESITLAEANEFMSIGKKLPVHALVACPESPQTDKYFYYSAFVGRRFWNECPTYVALMNNGYLPYRLFIKNDKFIPDYLSSKPRSKDYDSAFAVFRAALDVSLFPNPADRYEMYNRAVFESIDSAVAADIAEKNQWTHILVRNKDKDKLNSWVRSLEVIEGTSISIYKCPVKK